MPRIYLSPSTQEGNPYITGSGSEEYNMNLLADALEPYLYSNAIRFVRNTPDMTAASSIAQANSLGGFDFYLALHSNAAAPANSGNVRGIIVFYYPGRRESGRPSSSPRGSRRFIHCRGLCARHLPQRSARCASQGFRLIFSSSATTITTRMRRGSRTIWMRLHGHWPMR